MEETKVAEDIGLTNDDFKKIFIRTVKVMGGSMILFPLLLANLPKAAGYIGVAVLFCCGVCAILLTPLSEKEPNTGQTGEGVDALCHPEQAQTAT